MKWGEKETGRRRGIEGRDGEEKRKEREVGEEERKGKRGKKRGRGEHTLCRRKGDNDVIAGGEEGGGERFLRGRKGGK